MNNETITLANSIKVKINYIPNPEDKSFKPLFDGVEITDANGQIQILKNQN